MQKKHLGQCREAGVTEEHSEKAFGSMQGGWSDRRAFRKSIWVDAGKSGVTEEHSEKAFGSMQGAWSDRRACRKSIWVDAGGLE